MSFVKRLLGHELLPTFNKYALTICAAEASTIIVHSINVYKPLIPLPKPACGCTQIYFFTRRKNILLIYTATFFLLFPSLSLSSSMSKSKSKSNF